MATVVMEKKQVIDQADQAVVQTSAPESSIARGMDCSGNRARPRSIPDSTAPGPVDQKNSSLTMKAVNAM
jgi:hypothetical protein